jgi:hypothetical protein
MRLKQEYFAKKQNVMKYKGIKTLKSYCLVATLFIDLKKQEELTQEQLAEKAGTKKSYISRRMLLSTLIRIFEKGKEKLDWKNMSFAW